MGIVLVIPGRLQRKRLKMKKRIWLLPETGTMYKANLHCHTVISDGNLTTEEVKEAYRQRGYSIVAYTDHRIYRNHKELNDADFLAIAACEVDINDSYQTPGDFSRVKTYHINLYDEKPDYKVQEKLAGIMPDCPYNDTEGINRYLEKMREMGFLACYNHPYWSLQNYDDYKGLKGLWAMEIYNHGCEGEGMYGHHPQAYEELLRLGNRLFCVAADDNHNAKPFGDPLCDSFGGVTWIKAERLSYEAVMEALRQGHFYCSMGPVIRELYIEDGELVVRCSPVEKIFVMTEGRHCHKKLAAPGETIEEARFPLSKTEGYIRVDCQDGRGLHAHSNAYFLEEIDR